LLKGCHVIDSKIAESDVKSVTYRYWYLTEDLVGLAIFSNDVPVERKLTMLSALQKPAIKLTVTGLEAENISGKIGNIETLSWTILLLRDLENCLKSSQLIQHSRLTILDRPGLALRTARTLRRLCCLV